MTTLTSTVSTLQQEITTSNAEAERLHSELASLKHPPAASASEPDKEADKDHDHVLALEHRLREVLEQVEQLKVSVQTWESATRSERALRTEAEESLAGLRESKSAAETYAATLQDQLASEQKTSRELHDVLAELEASKADEVAQASNAAQEEISRLSLQLEQQKKLAQEAEVRILSSLPFSVSFPPSSFLPFSRFCLCMHELLLACGNSTSVLQSEKSEGCG